VAKNIPSFSVVVGSPARVIKQMSPCQLFEQLVISYPQEAMDLQDRCVKSGNILYDNDSKPRHHDT
jgi:hypothetical protein